MSAHSFPRYQPQLPNSWWLRHPGYFRYMLREMTSAAIGAYVGVLIIAILRLSQGPDAWNGFLTALGSTPGVILQGLALALATYHSITWFALAPRTMPLQIGERFVPGAWIAGAHYLAWALISAIVLIVVVGV